MKEVVWKWNCGVYVPFCPYCNEPAYEQEGCAFCRKPYKWAEGEIKTTRISKGDYTIVQTTNNHIHLYKNGELVMHAQHDKKKTEEELLEQIDFYEKLFVNDSEEDRR